MSARSGLAEKKSRGPFGAIPSHFFDGPKNQNDSSVKPQTGLLEMSKLDLLMVVYSLLRKLERFVFDTRGGSRRDWFSRRFVSDSMVSSYHY